MKKLFSILITFILSSNIFAQQQQVLMLNLKQIEKLFLKQNLQLIAERMNVDIADAQISQAKLWDNPELTISSVNLWSTKSQREEMEMNAFPKNTQFSIELSQLIQTANKRNKLINREKASKEITFYNFEEVLRGLKVGLRRSINELIYLQSYTLVLINQEQSLNQLIEVYKRQQAKGNIAKTELLRLQSSLLDLENEINDITKELNEQQKSLKVLLNIDPNIVIYIENANCKTVNPDNIPLAKLLQTATESRPDIKVQQLETQYHEKSLNYEKSLRIPDITLSANFDRYGGLWKDFIGFGVSFDLPVFNRNQGNIKAARISRDQSQYLNQELQNLARHEIAEALLNYTQAFDFYKRINENDLLSELDGMLDIYTKNLLNKNISMLEYIDFMDTYKSNKQTMLAAQKKVNTSFEELQYTIGNDIK